jgi:hypothetical protein
MALSHNFRDALFGTAVRISSLAIDKSYPVLHTERLETKYGTSVLLTLLGSDDNVTKVFSPKRYSVVFADDCTTTVNDMTVQYHMTLKGKCFKSNSYILQIRKVILCIQLVTPIISNKIPICFY